MNAIISIGSNCGDRKDNILKAIDYIKTIASIVSHSGIYESPDFTGTGKKYLNCIAEIETPLSFNKQRECFKAFEKECGRTPELKERGEVPVDIDIIVWGNEILRNKDYNSSYFKAGLALMAGCPKD